MPSNKPQLKAYVDTITYEKFRTLAEKEHRSTSNYIEILVTREIEKFESENGTINVKNLNLIDNRGSINNINM